MIYDIKSGKKSSSTNSPPLPSLEFNGHLNFFSLQKVSNGHLWRNFFTAFLVLVSPCALICRKLSYQKGKRISCEILR